MYRIIKIGMDVHSTNYTLCAMEPTVGAEDRVFGEIQVAPDYKEIILFIESLKMKLGFQDEVHYIIKAGFMCKLLQTMLIAGNVLHPLITDQNI